MAKKQWQPLDLETLPDITLLACDPSLTALGLVWVEVEDGTVTVNGAEKLSTAPTDRKGWDDTFYRSELMEALVDALLDSWLDLGLTDPLGVHEAPPAGGGDFVRSEATILSGYAFRRVCNGYDIPLDRTVTPQSHKKLITGNHLASKKAMAETIKPMLDKITGGQAVTNEATRDALSIALYAAHRIGAN